MVSFYAGNGDSGVGYNVTAYCINTTAIHVYYRIVSDGGDVDLLTMQYTCYINQTVGFSKPEEYTSYSDATIFFFHSRNTHILLLMKVKSLITPMF